MFKQDKVIDAIGLELFELYKGIRRVNGLSYDFPILIEAVNKARESIDACCYILDDWIKRNKKGGL